MSRDAFRRAVDPAVSAHAGALVDLGTTEAEARAISTGRDLIAVIEAY